MSLSGVAALASSHSREARRAAASETVERDSVVEIIHRKKPTNSTTSYFLSTHTHGVCVCVCMCVCVCVCVCASACASVSASACACVSSACGGPANLTVKDGYCCVCSANRKVNGRWTFIKEMLNIAPVCNTPQCNPPEPRGGSARAVRAPSAPRCEPNQKRTRQPDAPDTADDDSSTTRHYVTRSVRRKLAPTPSPPASPSPKQKSYDLSLMSP